MFQFEKARGTIQEESSTGQHFVFRNTIKQTIRDTFINIDLQESINIMKFTIKEALNAATNEVNKNFYDIWLTDRRQKRIVVDSFRRF